MAPEQPVLRRGDSGAEVERLQLLLADLDYWLAGADGIFGIRTEHAVVALQKTAGLDRTGVVDDATWAALEAGTRPTARTSSGRVLEVDLTRQILLVVQDGRVEAIIDVSTGRKGFRTPTGAFTIYAEVDGWHDSGWGSVWRPKYFYEPSALALHGYDSVPPYPASHGCIRLIDPAVDWLWDHAGVPVGTPVHIY